MAEIPMNGHGGVPQSSSGFATMANWAGAVVSMALLVGVGVWGYKLIMRDVSGVPVVRAAEGPMRVAPDNPGGSAAEHQGLAVNQVAGTGTAAPPPDQLTLAPRPLDLTQEDAPQATLSARAAKEDDAEAGGLPFLSSAGDEDFTVTDDAATTPEGTVDSDAFLKSVLAEAAEEDVDPAVLEGELEEQETATRFPGTLGQSLRPRIRPGGLRTAALAVTPVAKTTEEIASTNIPAGTPVVQLGAFDSVAVARSEWDRLNGRFTDFLADKSRVIQKASSGGRTFYRLRAHGFDDINDARRLCAALQAGKAECIPVSTR